MLPTIGDQGATPAKREPDKRQKPSAKTGTKQKSMLDAYDGGPGKREGKRKATRVWKEKDCTGVRQRMDRQIKKAWTSPEPDLDPIVTWGWPRWECLWSPHLCLNADGERQKRNQERRRYWNGAQPLQLPFVFSTLQRPKRGCEEDVGSVCCVGPCCGGN